MRRGERFNWREEADKALSEIREKRSRELKKPYRQRLVQTIANLRDRESRIKRMVTSETKARWDLAKELHRKYRQHAKNVYSKDLRHTINLAMHFFPPKLMHKVQKVLSITGQSVEKELLDRIAILPPDKYKEIDLLLDGDDTHGWHMRSIAFVNERTLDRKGVLTITAHEIIHLLERFAGLKRTPIEQEVLSNGLSLYLRSRVSRKRRDEVVAEAKISRETNTTYNRSVARGDQVFLLADEIRTRKGDERTKQFFWNLFLSEKLGLRDIKRVYNKALAT